MWSETLTARRWSVW